MFTDALIICVFGTWFCNISDESKKKQIDNLTLNQYLIIVVIATAFIDFFLRLL